MAALIMESTIIRALLVLMAISPSSAAAIYSSGGPRGGLPAIHAYKPSDVVFPGFVRPYSQHRPEGHDGFSGFVYELREAIRSKGGAPPPVPAQDRSFLNNNRAYQEPDTTEDSSVSLKVGQDPRSENSARIFLGTSVRQILREIPPTATFAGPRPASSVGSVRLRGRLLSSASGGGGLLSGGETFLSGGFLSEAGSGGSSGFGFDLRPMTFPTDPPGGAYVGPGGQVEVSKNLKALRRIVLDLVFNPFVYFGALIVSVLMFMTRFRNTVN
jgi:hypothetical protein